MMTFLAPASRCLAAASRLVKKPVDSITTSTPRSPHGSAAGSRSASALTSRPSTMSESPVASTLPGKRPYTESYLSRCASVSLSVMSLTAMISTSAPDSCAARKTLRPMRPKPSIPTRTGMAVKDLSLWLGRGREGYLLGSRRRAVHVAVLHLDEVAPVLAEVGGVVLRDHDRAVAAARAADRDDEVRLALGDVLRQQVLEQRQHAVLEVLQPPVAPDVADDPPVEAGQRAQVRLPVRVGEEADVEHEVRVARRPVLVAERAERDRELARLGRREHLGRDLAPQRRRAQARRVDDGVSAVADLREQVALAPDAVGDVAV